MVKDWTHFRHYFQLSETSTNRTGTLDSHSSQCPARPLQPWLTRPNFKAAGIYRPAGLIITYG